MTEALRIGLARAGLAGLGGDERVAVSFVVPAFNAERTLEASIGSVRAAAPAGSEIVVVDDGSLDGTLDLARRLADVVVTRPCQGGAARCRNDGARVSRGRVLFFVDSDVTVNPPAVAGALAHIAAGADAVFGAYQALPPPEVRNVPTTYKNLLHHFTHLRGDRDASTFWSGFGAVRREAFLAVTGFDPAVTTTADVEDIHLGYRLKAAGYRIVLDPTLQVLHHKRYTVRGLIESDVVHRAIPWTRAMLEMRSFRRDLNLRGDAMAGAAFAWSIPATLVLAGLLGPAWLGATAVLIAAWLRSNWAFLAYAGRAWSRRGALASAALLYLYFLYGPPGAALGVAAHLLRRDRRSILNWLRLEAGPGRLAPEVEVTVAVVATPGEPLRALEAMPAPAPWWELVVVSSAPREVPAGARFLPAPAGADRNAMRHLALLEARGEMFATLDGHFLPDPGWLERVRAAVPRSELVLAGSIRHHRGKPLQRAHQVVRYWQWRPERRPGWLVDHPATNAAFRTEVARRLGGFRVEGALMLRLAGFGARPVRFDPEMAAEPTTDLGLYRFLHGVAGVARLRAAASSRYFDMALPTRLALVATSPVVAARSLASVVRTAVREGSADRTFWLVLPLTSAGFAASWWGRVVGLVRPGSSGGVIPRSEEDLSGLAGKLSAVPGS